MQKINQIGEYAIHISLYLAVCHSEGRKVISALEISESQNISLNYTQQILMKLRQGKLIESERGPKGGFFLAKTPEQISLKEILTLSEGDTMDIICESRPINLEKCSKEAHCFLKNVWYGLKDVIDNYLEKITIKDLLTDLVTNESNTLVKIKSRTFFNDNLNQPKEL